MTPARILVVDDNDDNLELMQFMLSHAGYTPVLARGGREAIRLAAEAPPDLVLMDIQMPDVDGFEAAAAIRAHDGGARFPIVAVTALAMVGVRDRVLATGLDGYIAKPVAPTLLIGQVEQFLPAEQRARPHEGPPA